MDQATAGGRILRRSSRLSYAAVEEPPVSSRRIYAKGPGSSGTTTSTVSSPSSSFSSSSTSPPLPLSKEESARTSREFSRASRLLSLREQEENRKNASGGAQAVDATAASPASSSSVVSRLALSNEQSARATRAVSIVPRQLNLPEQEENRMNASPSLSKVQQRACQRNAARASHRKELNGIERHDSLPGATAVETNGSEVFRSKGVVTRPSQELYNDSSSQELARRASSISIQRRVSEIHPSESDVIDENAGKIQRRNISVVVVACGLVVLISLVVGVAVGVAMSKANDREKISEDVPQDASQEPTLSPTHDFASLELLDELLDVVGTLSPDALVFDDPESPQHRALDWLAFEDYKWTFGDGTSVTSITDNDTPELDSRLIARYSLAVFYFSTGGNGEQSSWADDLSFLSPGIHECEWNDGLSKGVFCEEDGSTFSISNEGAYPPVTRLVIGQWKSL